jgi:hypothetical protein
MEKSAEENAIKNREAVKNKDKITVTIPLDKLFPHKALEERAAEFGGQLNLDGEYDFGTPAGKEVW